VTARVAAPWLGAEESRRVLAALGRDGRPARFVGGCVRDALLDSAADATDLDLATPEPPERVMALLDAAGIRPLPTGLRHGTVSAQVGGRRFEVTTLRRDVATDGRHAVVAFTDDFDADAARRDFTINAMSCDGDGTLHDPVGGREDLAAGRVRFVGEARRRIAEDYLRILRFFRFQARFGRGAPDAEALAACAELAAGVDRLSGERVRRELWLILAGPRPAPTLALMADAGVLGRIMPGEVVPPRLDRLAEPDPLLRLAALVRPAAPARAHALADRLKLANQERERLVALASTAMPDLEAGPPAQRLAAHRLGAGLYRDLVLLGGAEGLVDPATARRLAEWAATWRAPEFPLGGADLLALGVPPGPGLGRILAQVRREWEEGDFRLDRAGCLARAGTLAGAATPRHLTP
jgi:poly(A) polymerase